MTGIWLHWVVLLHMAHWSQLAAFMRCIMNCLFQTPVLFETGLLSEGRDPVCNCWMYILIWKGSSWRNTDVPYNFRSQARLFYDVLFCRIILLLFLLNVFLNTLRRNNKQQRKRMLVTAYYDNGPKSKDKSIFESLAASF